MNKQQDSKFVKRGVYAIIFMLVFIPMFNEIQGEPFAEFFVMVTAVLTFVILRALEVKWEKQS